MCFVILEEQTEPIKLKCLTAFERANQEAFETATAIDPSFHLTIPCPKTLLNKYLASSLLLLKEKPNEKFNDDEKKLVEKSIYQLIYTADRVEEEGQNQDDAYDNL